MRFTALFLLFGLSTSAWPSGVDASGAAEPTEIHLQIDAGTPLRVYLSKRMSVKQNQPVHGKLLEDVYAFDRVVIPAGSEVSGTIVRLTPVSRTKRVLTILGGDFTPLHTPEVKFDEAVLPDGKKLSFLTSPAIGLPLVVSTVAAKAKSSKVSDMARDRATVEIRSQINSRTYGLSDVVRGPGKLERFEDLLCQKLPYHPQWIKKGTRYDAILSAPIDFGAVTMSADALKLVGSAIPDGRQVQALLLSGLSSDSSQVGDRFQAKLAQPLFSIKHELLLPQGTNLEGVVTQVHAAKYFHRGGILRFRFEKADLPQSVLKTHGQIDAVEGERGAALKIDDEGGVKATESNLRLLKPALAGLIAMKTLDNDEGRVHPDGNYGGRALGGGSGFGLLGTIAGESSRYVGSALGFYGLGWSVYQNVVARGQEVVFRKNTAMDVRFGNRPERPKAQGVMRRLLEQSGNIR